MLIVVSGTIASGKSTVARRVAEEFAAQSVASAVIDIDLVYEMLRPPGARKDAWALVRRGAAALADAFAANGVEVVIVDGDFLSVAERADFLEALRGDPPAPLFVTLRVPFEQASKRVGQDPTRTFSRDLAFLRRHYDAAARDGLPGDLVLDTDETTPIEVARRIVEWAERQSTD